MSLKYYFIKCNCGAIVILQKLRQQNNTFEQVREKETAVTTNVVYSAFFSQIVFCCTCIDF